MNPIVLVAMVAWFFVGQPLNAAKAPTETPEQEKQKYEFLFNRLVYGSDQPAPTRKKIGDFLKKHAAVTGVAAGAVTWWIISSHYGVHAFFDSLKADVQSKVDLERSSAALEESAKATERHHASVTHIHQVVRDNVCKDCLPTMRQALVQQALQSPEAKEAFAAIRVVGAAEVKRESPVDQWHKDMDWESRFKSNMGLTITSTLGVGFIAWFILKLAGEISSPYPDRAYFIFKDIAENWDQLKDQVPAEYHDFFQLCSKEIKEFGYLKSFAVSDDAWSKAIIVTMVKACVEKLGLQDSEGASL